MAGYVYLKDGNRTKRHRFIIHRTGVKAYSKTFVDKRSGEVWARGEETSIENTGNRTGIEQLHRVFLRDIAQRYLDEITPTKANDSEVYVLQRFKAFVKDKTLASFTKQDAYEYINKRRKDTWKGPKGNWKTAKPITARTISREVRGSIAPMFEVAREQWGYNNVVNPFSGVEIKGSKHRRKRRLLPGELERLVVACQNCLGLNRLYVPLAMYLAIETGMRLDEIFNLSWQDLDFKKRTIEIIKSKTDDATGDNGRTIVMTFEAGALLQRLSFVLQRDGGTYKNSDLIFPMTKDAFEQSFDDVLTRAKIKPDRRGERLQFRDLRREAGSRFDEAGLTKAENEFMLGHQGEDTNSIYIAATLKSIRDKLDKYALGMTMDEIDKRVKAGEKVKLKPRITGYVFDVLSPEEKTMGLQKMIAHISKAKGA